MKIRIGCAGDCGGDRGGGGGDGEDGDGDGDGDAVYLTKASITN